MTTVSSPSPPVIQGQDLIYALDIGTRSVIGILGRVVDDHIQVEAIEKQLHTKRTMMDGQIEDISQVARTVAEVTRRLEQNYGVKLTHASVAAAGRALQTEQGHSILELPAPERITEERIGQLEAAAVAEAEQALQSDHDEGNQRLFLVGYTSTQLLLDHYPLTTLLGHTGQVLEAHVVATFLPSEVIDSLYAVMRQAGLEVASLTLEPIAALNAAIPSDLRLLNLALVDIGAGTSDIAICRDGGVVGYTMTTVAGDEITEALMRQYLIDFDTAEALKAQLTSDDTPIRFTDILGLEQRIQGQEILEAIEKPMQSLAENIAQHVTALNGTAPSALFLAGGGSKLINLREKVAQALNMDEKRVAIAGGHFKRSILSNEFSVEDPEYTTPFGIAVSAGLGLISDSYRVMLNDAPAKLFRSGRLTALEVLMMNGFSYNDLLGRNGKNLIFQVDGVRTMLHGDPSTPAQLFINDVEVQPSAIVNAGDKIRFTPAQSGADCCITVGELKQQLDVDYITVNGEWLDDDEPIPSGASVLTTVEPPSFIEQSEEPVLDEPSILDVPSVMDEPSEQPTQALSTTPEVSMEPPTENTPDAPAEATSSAASPVSCSIFFNGAPLDLPPKPEHTPYYLMDLLEYSGIDFKNVSRPVILLVNGADASFQQLIHNGDHVDIRYQDE